MNIWEQEFKPPQFKIESAFGILEKGKKRPIEFSDEESFEKYRTENIRDIEWIKRKKDKEYKFFGTDIRDIESFNKREKDLIDLSYILRSSVFGLILFFIGMDYFMNGKVPFSINIFIAVTTFFIVIPFIRNALKYSKIKKFNYQNLEYEIKLSKFKYWFSDVKEKEPGI